MFILLEHKQGFLFIFLVLFSVSNLGVVNSRLNSRDPGRRHKIIVRGDLSRGSRARWDGRITLISS